MRIWTRLSCLVVGFGIVNAMYGGLIATDFNSAFIIGMAAEIGCAATACDLGGSYATSSGAESFTLVYLGNPPRGEDLIPETATLLLMGGVLGAIGLLRYRRKDS